MYKENKAFEGEADEDKEKKDGKDEMKGKEKKEFSPKKQSNGKIHKETHSQANEQTHKETHSQANEQTHKETHSQANEQTHSQATPQTHSQADEQKETKEKLRNISYDELMAQIGEFGGRQLAIFLAYAVGVFVEVLLVMSFVFAAGSHQSHHCREPGLEHLNLSAEMSRNISGGGLDGCHMFFRDYTNWSMHTVDEWLANYPNVTTTVVECRYGYEYDAHPYEDTIVTEWDLVCRDEWKAYLPYSIVGVGEAVGSLFWGVLIDRVGRMYPFLYSLLTLITLSLASAFSPHYPAYCVIQFFIGVHAVATYSIGPTAIVEISGVKYRGHLLTAFNYFWTLGNLVLPLVAYFVRRWSKLQIALSLLSLLSLVLLIFVTESPRWLYSKGKKGKAQRILQKVASSNNKVFPSGVRVVFEDDQESNNNTISLFHLFSTCNLTCISAVLCLTWFSNSLLYFGLSLHLPTMSQNPHLNYFISGLVEVPGYVIAQLCLSFVARRVAVSGLFACTAVCLFVLLPVTATELLPLRIGLALVGKMLATSLMSVLGCFTSEIFPTVARGSGLFLCILFSNLANILAPQFNLLNKQLPPTIFASFAIVSAFVCLLLPETKDHPLCDTAQEMRKHRKAVSLKRCLCIRSNRKLEKSTL